MFYLCIRWNLTLVLSSFPPNCLKGIARDQHIRDWAPFAIRIRFYQYIFDNLLLSLHLQLYPSLPHPSSFSLSFFPRKRYTARRQPPDQYFFILAEAELRQLRGCLIRAAFVLGRHCLRLHQTFRGVCSRFHSCMIHAHLIFDRPSPRFGCVITPVWLAVWPEGTLPHDVRLIFLWLKTNETARRKDGETVFTKLQVK